MKRVAIGLALLMITAATWALEFDFRAAGEAQFSDEGQTTSGTGDVTLTRRITQDHRVSLRLQGAISSVSEPNAYLRELVYTGNVPLQDGRSVVGLTVGRTRISEVSGLFTPLTLDGFVVSWNMPGFAIQGLATTTALLRPEESLLLTATDTADSSAPDAFFGPQRYLAGVTVTLPETFATANIYAQYLAQIDGRGFGAPASGEELLNSHYAMAGVTGPLAPRLFASSFLFGNLATAELVGSGATTYLGYGARAEVRSFPAVTGRPTGTASVLFASGDNDGAISATPSGELTTLFAPGPYATPWSLADVPLANVIAGTLRGTYLPFDWSDDPAVRRTRVDARTTAIYRPWSIDPGAPGVDPAAGAGWYGTELAAALILEPFTDLDVRAEGAIFLPTGSENGGVYPPGTGGSWRITVEAALDF